jgi:hypothetical protein
MKLIICAIPVIVCVTSSLESYAHGTEPEPCRVAVDNRYQLVNALFPAKKVAVVSTQEVIYDDKSGSYYECARGKLASNGLCLYEDNSMLVGKNTERPSKKTDVLFVQKLPGCNKYVVVVDN